jgi:hypothetical protein
MLFPYGCACFTAQIKVKLILPLLFFHWRAECNENKMFLNFTGSKHKMQEIH